MLNGPENNLHPLEKGEALEKLIDEGRQPLILFGTITRMDGSQEDFTSVFIPRRQIKEGDAMYMLPEGTVYVDPKGLGRKESFEHEILTPEQGNRIRKRINTHTNKPQA